MCSIDILEIHYNKFSVFIALILQRIPDLVSYTYLSDTVRTIGFHNTFELGQVFCAQKENVLYALVVQLFRDGHQRIGL